jgi:hypothetical protein
VVLQHLVSVAHRHDGTAPGAAEQQEQQQHMPTLAGSSGSSSCLSHPQPSTCSCISTLPPSASTEPFSCDSDAPATLGSRRRSVDDTGGRHVPAGSQHV